MWRVDRTSDGGAFKLVLQHGRAFTKEPPASIACAAATTEGGGQETLLENAVPAASVAGECQPDFLPELLRRGITERAARRLLSSLPPSRDVLRQLEWGDDVIARMGETRVWNPAGLYVALLRDNVEPPANFLSSRDLQARGRSARSARSRTRASG